MYPDYNARFISIVKKYASVISGQFFGHHHTDSYRMFYGDDGEPVSTDPTDDSSLVVSGCKAALK